MKCKLIIIFFVLALSIMTAGVYGVNISDSIPPSGVTVQATPIGSGFFEFRCNIEGAGVFLDDTAVGTITNGTLKVSIPVFERPLKRQLRMEASGYTIYNETLLNGPKVDETMIVRGNLQVLPFNLTGTLSLAVNPPGGQVSIDDIALGIVPQSGIITFRTVKSGNRIVKVAMSGYQDYTNKVYIEANMITNLRITLIPLTTGTLQITSNPSGAHVSINGSPVGISPVTAPNLEQGTYTIEYSMPGYQPYQSQVVLTPGQTIPVSGTLQPIPTPTTIPTTPEQTPVPTPQPTEAGLPAGIAIFGLLAAFSLSPKKGK